MIFKFVYLKCSCVQSSIVRKLNFVGIAAKYFPVTRKKRQNIIIMIIGSGGIYCGLPPRYKANFLVQWNMKKGWLLTPCICVLDSFIFELKDSAKALVSILLK